ncbi:MAG: OmpH family outer membrane protein [Defluviicoccus sp.]|nr:OmpH family outer membrane protein [Defluviicoccus sp.]
MIAVGVLSIGASSLATAQDKSPSIGIVDVQKVLRESQASKALRPQIEKLRKNYQTSVRKREAELRKASQELQRQRAILSPQAFAKRRNAYEQSARKAQVDFQQRKRQLDNAYGKAMRTIQQSLVVAAAKIAEERKFDIVLPKSLVLLADQKLDITGEVLRRIDKSLPSVKLEPTEPTENKTPKSTN